MFEGALRKDRDHFSRLLIEKSPDVCNFRRDSYLTTFCQNFIDHSEYCQMPKISRKSRTNWTQLSIELKLLSQTVRTKDRFNETVLTPELD